MSLRPSSSCLTGRLLRTHVGRRPDRAPGLREVSVPAATLTALAMPKSVTIASPSCSITFSGLMSRCTTPWPVGVVQGRGHVARDLERVLQRQLPLALEPLAQRFALDVGHDVVEQIPGLAGIVERHDVGMIEPGGDLDLRAGTARGRGWRRGGDAGP